MGNFAKTTRLLAAALVSQWYLAQTAPAQTVSPSSANFALSLTQAFQRAETSNPLLLAAQRALPVGLAGITIAGASPNPQVALTYGFGSIYSVSGNPQQVGVA